MNNDKQKKHLFPSASAGSDRRRHPAQGLAAKGLSTIERTVTDFVSALPVLDMAFLLLVLTYVKTS